MDVPLAFVGLESASVAGFPALTIDASAPYLLAAPAMPLEVHEEAVERAD
jgi:hypothetical protein